MGKVFKPGFIYSQHQTESAMRLNGERETSMLSPLILAQEPQREPNFPSIVSCQTQFAESNEILHFSAQTKINETLGFQVKE